MLGPRLRADTQNQEGVALTASQAWVTIPLKNSSVQSMIDFTEIRCTVIWGSFILCEVRLTFVKTYFTIILHTHLVPLI